jgi:peptidylprolyl isomerase
MKKLLLAAAASLCLHAAVAADTDPVVAERGTAEITASQARALIAAADPETQRKLKNNPSGMQEFLRNVLLQQAILEEAKAQKWDQRPEVVAMLQRVRDQALIESFLHAQAPVPAGYPGEAEVQAAYDQYKGRLMQPRTYHLAQIVLAAATPHGDDARKRLADLRGRLLRGRMNFEDSAKTIPGAKYADLGFAAETQLSETVKAAVVGLPEGGITEPLCAPGGCTLFRLIATRAAGPAPLGDVHEQLVRALKQQKAQQAVQAYANTLLTKQPIQINEIQLAHLSGAP